MNNEDATSKNIVSGLQQDTVSIDQQTVKNAMFSKNVAVLIGITVSIVIGYIYGAITFQFDIFIISAAAVGWVIYFLSVFLAVNSTTYEDPLKRITTFAIVFGLLIFGMSIYAKYNVFRSEVAKELGGELNKEELTYATDLFLVEETGSKGLLGYYIYDVNNSSISYRGRSEVSTGSFGWIIELVKIAIVIFIPAKKIKAEWG